MKRTLTVLLAVLFAFCAFLIPVSAEDAPVSQEETVAESSADASVENVASSDAEAPSEDSSEAVSEDAEEASDDSSDTASAPTTDKPDSNKVKKEKTPVEDKTWIDQLKKTFVEGERYKWLIDGLKNTMIITFGALIIGVIIGSLIAVAKYFAEGNKKLRFVNFLCDLYTTVIRGIPITVLLLAFFYIILVSAEGLTVAIIAFGINSGAYMAELIRGGINAVDKGQMEAARSLGLSKSQAMWKIILPQAIKNILPAIGNECIALLKETSVAGYVAIVDLTRAANNIRNKTFDAINPIIVLALVYLIIVVVMTKLLAILERRLRRSDGK